MPLTANFDAAPAIAAECFASRIVASGLHPSPNAGDSRPAASMLRLHLAWDFTSQASARVSSAPNETFSAHHCVIAAGTPATPEAAFVGALPDIFDCHQLTEGPTSEIGTSGRYGSQFADLIQWHVLQLSPPAGTINQ